MEDFYEFLTHQEYGESEEDDFAPAALKPTHTQRDAYYGREADEQPRGMTYRAAKQRLRGEI